VTVIIELIHLTAKTLVLTSTLPSPNLLRNYQIFALLDVYHPEDTFGDGQAIFLIHPREVP
jgi:hypothetical protein